MATIGRMAAVAKVEWPFKAHLSGFPPGSPGSSSHLLPDRLPQPLAVFSQWIWTYFTFSRGARLITGDQSLPGWQDRSTPARSLKPTRVPRKRVEKLSAFSYQLSVQSES